MSRPNLLVLAMQGTAASWPQFNLSGDPNLVDVFHVAKSVAAALNIAVPTRLPEKSRGVRLVECVESTLVKGQLIRGLPRGVLSDRGLLVVQRMQDEHVLDYLTDARALYNGAANVLTSALFS